MTKKVWNFVIKTENRMLGALSKLDEFLLNSQVLLQSGNVPRASLDTSMRNEEPNKGRSQIDPQPELDDTENMNHHTMIPESNAVLYRI